MNRPPDAARAGGLMHLSDLHFGCEDPVALRALDALVGSVRPELIAVTGDLTQRATRAQFEQAHAFLASLSVPCLAVQPGNHDVPLWAVWERLGSPFRRYSRVFGADRTPVVDLPWVRLVMAESVAPWRHAEGELTERETRRVADLLAQAAPHQLRLVALHHPPVGGEVALAGGLRALQVWTEAGADLVISGHGHRPAVLPLATTGERRAWSVMAGTAVSRRLRHGRAASVSTLLPAGGHRGVWLQRWDLDSRQGRFKPQVPQLLALREGPVDAPSGDALGG